jgi:hypothetical protein
MLTTNELAAPRVGASPNAGGIRAVLRWLVMLPAGVLAGWALYAAVVFLNRISTTGYIDFDDQLESFLFRVYLTWVSHVAMVVAGLYVCARIAPSHKKNVVLIVAALCILATGFLLFPAVVTGAWWSVYAGVATAVGAAGTAWAVYSGGLDPG